MTDKLGLTHPYLAFIIDYIMSDGHLSAPSPVCLKCDCLALNQQSFLVSHHPTTMTSLLSRTDSLHLDPDAALLEALTFSPLPMKKDSFRRRHAELDTILLAAAAASGPNVTRNHYAHDFLPGTPLPKAEGAWDWSDRKSVV